MTQFYLVAAGLLVALLTSAFAGWEVATWRADSQRVQSVERAIAQAAELAEQDAEVLRHAEVRVAATETRFRTINREVIRYVQTHDPVDCLDADGLRLWQDANTGADAPAAASPDYTLRALVDAHIRKVFGFAEQPRGGGAAVSPVPGPAGSAGRLGNGETVNQED